MSSKTSLGIFILLIAVIIQVQTARRPRHSSSYYSRLRTYLPRTPTYKLRRLFDLLDTIRELLKLLFSEWNLGPSNPPQIPELPPPPTKNLRNILSNNDGVRVTRSSSETKMSHSSESSNLKSHSYSITPKPAIRRTLGKPPVKTPEPDNEPNILDILFGPEAN